MDILYLDDVMIAVHKPSGLLVHRSLIDKHETRFALQLVRDQIGQRVYPVHRLDKPTSGILVFALNPETARELTAQFTAGRVQKTYRAIVRGYTQSAGVIDYALREELDKIADVLADPDKAPQQAITHYQRLSTVELPHPVGHYRTARYSLVALQPKTGRKHQIRRHLKHIFHPVVGDTTHGDGRHNQFFRDHFGNQRLLLAATAMELIHPHSGEPLAITAPPGADFECIVNALGWGQVA
ncbi:tRNA pseudouridine(65) synthase TruC [uncultured Thiodictyon sp.]|uniref:tRNA pseudouridine(65) synthase TruC n=1 Tax=uncultured Thiodictyon sp. TaxID=1846217 RepID=UPI0025F6CC8A|nr:tRNA pseudouridine(65) synthase TruC [uncultured Thiodictyon sp.]